MILTAARVLESLLACSAILIAVRSPRHRVFAWWITLSLCYSLADKLWIVPLLGRAPRPFTGELRLFLHLSQLLYITAHASFVSVVFHFARLPKWVRPLPYFIVFVAMVALVDGYGHSPGPGLYLIRGIVFRSRTIYLLVEVAVNLIVLGTILSGLRTHIEEASSTDDTAILGSLLAMTAAGVASNIFDAFPAVFPTYAVPLGYLVSYALAFGFHAPVLFLHARGEKSDTYRHRQALSERREAIYAMGDRMKASRAAFARVRDHGVEGPGSFPTVWTIARQGGLMFRFLETVLEDLDVAERTELMLSAVWGLGPQKALHMLRVVAIAIDDEAEGRAASPRETFPWNEVFAASPVGPETFLAPLAMSAFVSLRDLTWDQARKATKLATLLAEGAAGEKGADRAFRIHRST